MVQDPEVSSQDEVDRQAWALILSKPDTVLAGGGVARGEPGRAGTGGRLAGFCLLASTSLRAADQASSAVAASAMGSAATAAWCSDGEAEWQGTGGRSWLSTMYSWQRPSAEVVDTAEEEGRLGAAEEVWWARQEV